MIPVRRDGYGIPNPNRSTWGIFKDNQGELNVVGVTFGLFFFYFFFLWIIYGLTRVGGIPADYGTWIARGGSGFLTGWATLGNLRGRLYLAVIVVPALVTTIVYLTITLNNLFVK